METKNILICGYPKSGTHWLSLLTTNLCKGVYAENWGFEPKFVSKNEIEHALFAIYKAHHLFNDLKDASTLKIYKIIYIVRDPRDIAISGSYFFRFTFPAIKKFLCAFGKIGNYLYQKTEGILNRLLTIKQKRYEMLKALVFGNKSVSLWCENSWDMHLSSFENTDVLVVRYEDLQNNLNAELAKIASYLELTVTNKTIEETISKSQFNKQKEAYKGIYPLYRKGKSGYWQNELTTKEKHFFITHLSAKLLKYNYL